MKNKKSLQKITEIENLNTIKEVKEFIKNNSNLRDDVWDSLSDRLHESYAEGLGKDTS